MQLNSPEPERYFKKLQWLLCDVLIEYTKCIAIIVIDGVRGFKIAKQKRLA
jgi:hypothetical protein